MIQTFSDSRSAGIQTLILSLVGRNLLNTNDLYVDLRGNGRFVRILVLNAKVLC